MSIINKQHIYLPSPGVDPSKWAVMSASEFKHDKEYWERVENYVSDSPTTLNLILPEIYYSLDNKEKIKKINENMLSYFKNRIIMDKGTSMVLVCRSTPNTNLRLGLMLNIDLEEFDYHEESKSSVRCIKPTILEKIIPRLEIRKDNIFEASHTILLYDDRSEKIAETLFNNRDKLQKIYDFNLNMGGGHLTGYQVKDVDMVIEKFDRLLKPEYLEETFHLNAPVLFLVGDGNHSLAVAKEHWNRIKKDLSEEVRAMHPARYALVEAVNIHDSGIKFQGIHKIIKNVNIRRFLRGLKKLTHHHFKRGEEKVFTSQRIFVNGGELTLKMPYNSLITTKKIQEYVDSFLEKEIEMTIDYTNDLSKLKEVCIQDKKSIGIEVLSLDKNKIFEYVIKYGFLPRKTFEVVSQREKKYYYELHKIKLI